MNCHLGALHVPPGLYSLGVHAWSWTIIDPIAVLDITFVIVPCKYIGPLPLIILVKVPPCYHLASYPCNTEYQ